MKQILRSAFWARKRAKLLSVLSALLVSLPAWSPREFALWLQQAIPDVSVPIWVFSLAGVVLVAVQVVFGSRRMR